MGNDFGKKAMHGGSNLFGKVYGGMFYMGPNDQIMQEGELMVKRFQKSSKVTFPLIEPDLGCWYITWKGGLGDWIWKTPSAHWDWGFHVKPVFIYIYILGPVLWCLGFRAYLDLHAIFLLLS